MPNQAGISAKVDSLHDRSMIARVAQGLTPTFFGKSTDTRGREWTPPTQWGQTCGQAT